MDTQDTKTNPIQPPIAQVNYEALSTKVAEAQIASKQSEKPDPDKEIYNRIASKFAVHPSANKDQQIPLNTNRPTISTDPQETIHTFSSHSLPITTPNIGEMVSKFFLFFLTTSPLLIILVGFMFFMMENKFNIAMTTVYPAWAAEKVESLVREAILPAANN
jgi:hypothetical protein